MDMGHHKLLLAIADGVGSLYPSTTGSSRKLGSKYYLIMGTRGDYMDPSD